MKILKTILMVLCASFIGIVSNPEMLTASDSVSVTGLNPAGIVETVLPAKPDAGAASEENDYVEVYDYQVEAVAPVYYAVAEPVYYTPVNYINVNGNIVEIEDTSVTYSNAGALKKAWYYSSGKFIYGHNTYSVFAGLYNLGVGSTFTVAHGGTTRTYTVSRIVIFDALSDGYTLRSTEDGRELTMYPIVNARYDGINHSMSLMTCYGPNSSQRFVVFAD